MFNALRYRNFRLYLGGQFISLIGTWMQNLATSWLVYRLTGSTFWLGVSTFCSQIPTFILGLFAGVIVDRMNRHRLLIWTQSAAAIQASILAALTFSGRAHLHGILALSIALGIINALDTPARQSFLIQIIDEKKDLTNAIALNSSVMNGTRLIGPAIAGLLIHWIGEGGCFLVNALSYVAVIFALTQIRIEKTLNLVKKSDSVLESLQDGLLFVSQSIPVKTVLILLTVLSLVGAPFMTLFPAMADRVFHGGANTLGILTASTGMGAFCAAFFLATRKNILKLSWIIGTSAIGFSLSLVLLAFVKQIHLAIPILFVAGCGMMLQMASSNMLIQSLVDDSRRGRVMSLFTISLMGIAPFGSLFVGGIAHRCGVTITLFVSGVVYLLAAFWFWNQRPGMNQEVESHYLKMGA